MLFWEQTTYSVVGCEDVLLQERKSRIGASVLVISWLDARCWGGKQALNPPLTHSRQEEDSRNQDDFRFFVQKAKTFNIQSLNRRKASYLACLCSINDLK